MALSPEVEELIEKGELAAITLVRFDLPGKVVGYHNGGRPYTHNGLRYLPNKFLSPGSMRGSVGSAVTRRTLTFSGIPGEHADDVIAKIESYDYQNRTAVVTVLAGVPRTNVVAGVLLSSIYEIAEIRYPRGAVDGSGVASLRVDVLLEPPGRSVRGATFAMRSQAEQQYDNDPADTFFEYTATAFSVPRRFGQLRR